MRPPAKPVLRRGKPKALLPARTGSLSGSSGSARATERSKGPNVTVGSSITSNAANEMGKSKSEKRRQVGAATVGVLVEITDHGLGTAIVDGIS